MFSCCILNCTDFSARLKAEFQCFILRQGYEQTQVCVLGFSRLADFLSLNIGLIKQLYCFH